MVLLNPTLLLGLLLGAIPVILHLMMRAKPKKLLFPALRLIEKRRRQSVQRLRLRHLWLLLLRVAVIALLVLAVARPSVPAVDYSLTAWDWSRLLTLAAVLAGVYFGFTWWWRRRRLPPGVVAHHRSLLRAGVSVAGVLLFVLLVAWPYEQRIAASIDEPTLAVGENVPVAAVLLFDTSLSMQYRFESKTRLERAQEIAIRHVSNLPNLSRIAVGDNGTSDSLRFLPDLAGVQSRIEALAIQPASRPLNDRLEAAVELQLDDRERLQEETAGGGDRNSAETLLREIYIFTDLAATGWRLDGSSRLKEQLNRLPGLNVYIIDVGVLAPTNVGITELALSEQTIPLGSELTVRATVEATGVEPAEKTVEIYFENDAGRLVKQGQTTARVDPQTAAEVEFPLRGLTGPIAQGEVRIVASDPLAFDDVRQFTVEIRPPQEVLVVADDRADAQYLMQALAPTELLRAGKARYRCTFAPSSRLASENLSRFAVVCLINVADPQPKGWQALEGYLEQGGGVGIVLGSRVNHVAYLSPAAQRVLPGELLAVLKFVPPEFLDLKNLAHPLLKRFADWGVAELTSVEIARYWRVDPADDASVIASFTDERHSPALIERAHQKGLAVLLTTGLDRNGWNDLPVSGWSFVAFADQLVQYLSQAGQSQFNFAAGQDVLIALDTRAPIPQRYLLRKPALQQLPGEIPPGADELRLQNLDQLGNYRLIGADPESKFESGFTVTADVAESRLARLDEQALQDLLGEKRVSVSRSIEELERSVLPGRVGREIFPVLLMVLILAFCGEHLVGNYFYERESPRAA